MEIWKNIEVLDNKVQVSNYGRVKSLPNQLNKEEIIRKPVLSNGYLRLGFYVNKKQKYHSIHRLVALAFIPNPFNLPEVNHINGNKEDNNVNNLEWISPRDNKNHAIDNNLYAVGEENGNSKLSEKEVLDIYYLLKEGIRVEIITNKYNISKSSVLGIKSGTQWSHLNLTALKGRASSMTLEIILEVETLLLNNTVREISRITGYARETIRKIKDGNYSRLKELLSSL